MEFFYFFFKTTETKIIVGAKIEAHEPQSGMVGNTKIIVIFQSVGSIDH